MDVVNSEKIEETFGINGYYGDGQMMNWFSPPTTIQNVRGVDYEATPYGVPTDEFWWIKQNRYNRDRINAMAKNTVNIYPNALPSGDRLEDYFSNMNSETYKTPIKTIMKAPILAKGALVKPISEVVVEDKPEEVVKVSKEAPLDDKILGMPKMVAIGLGVAVLAIGGFVVYKKFIKK